MRGLLHRLRLSGKEASPDPRAALLNPATQVTLKALVDLQRHARKLDLRQAQPARARLAGNHPSRFRGRGMDYQESRTYQPGDDIRNMDWRVTARAGRAHTKLFQEERERPVVLFVDLGPGMFFATRGALKSVVAARAATLLGWACAAQGDRIGALLSNGGYFELKPRSGHRGVLPLVHALVEHSNPVQGLAGTDHADRLNGAFIRLRRIVRPGSLVFLLSDFYGLDDDTASHLHRLHRHNDLVALRISDPLELAPPPPGRYGITDGKQSGVLDTRSAACRQDYNDFFRQQRDKLEQTLLGNAIPLLDLSTTDDVVSTLQAGLGRYRSPAKRSVA